MSPRVLRNTYARQLLLAGRTIEEASALLRLASDRTGVRLRATIDRELSAPALTYGSGNNVPSVTDSS